MSLDKAIKSGKEHRKQYEGNKYFFKSCRNHGSCKWCKDNRTYRNIKNKAKSEVKDE